MPYLPTSQEWLTQSALLLQARPTSARITTKYTLSKPSTTSLKRKAAAASSTPSDPSSTTPPAPSAPKATLTLKTYDPVSGTTLKYQTDKAQEVGRLILSLSRLGRDLAGLEELKETVGEAMEGVEQQGEGGREGGRESGTATPVVGQGTGDKPVAKKGKKKGKK